MPFLDPSYAIAISVADDAAHERAMQLAQMIEQTSTRVVTTNGILIELGDALSKPRYRRHAPPLLDYLRHDAAIKVVNLSAELLERAIELYRQRPDKEWGLTDCGDDYIASFVVMQERGMTDALTADEHFQQAGFRALSREA